MDDFELWNKHKKQIHTSNNNRFVNEGDIWWCNLGINIGSEQNGKNERFERPVIIIKKFSNKTCLIAPLTTSENNHHFRINLGEIDTKRSKLILSQIRTIDTKRLFQKIEKMSTSKFLIIRKNIRELF